MEQFAIPGRAADPVVAGLFPRLIPDAGDLIGLADLVVAAAFRHRLPERDDALAERRAVVPAAATGQAETEIGDDEK